MNVESDVFASFSRFIFYILHWLSSTDLGDTVTVYGIIKYI
jgi:hypothetical protein